ncbi:DNA polymerase [Psychrobacter pygoscelis]|uniref:DNA polymerase n=1 Tax=Psychrobacter pygoscelis TaxID=2488563 RepID=UPI003100C87A
MATLYLDLETFSETPIKHGTYKYAANAEILLFAYAFDDASAKVIDLTDVDPNDEWGFAEKLTQIDLLLSCADQLVAHNSMFDRNVLEANGFNTPHYKWRDTMIKAYCHSLPGGLATLCDVLNIKAEHTKAADGRKLIHLFCKPLGKNRNLERATRETHPDEWAKFVEYARLDVEAMRAIDKAMPEWNMATEQRHWQLDQIINDRGFTVDTELVDTALKAIAVEKKRLAKQTQNMTDGAVDSATQRDAMLEYILSEYGITLPNLQKATLERRIADPDLPDAVKDLLNNRLQASTTSTSKYQALARSVNDDGRLRGTLQFAGAARTGRWAGRTFQPQNLPRPSLKQAEIDTGIEALKLGCADMLTDNLMELTSSAIRGCIVAPEDKKLVVSDLSNIEGRAQAWLADESWKIKAFSEFDRGIGDDLYKLAYAKSFGVSPKSVTKDQRQIGKVQELALGYGGGVGAFVTFASVYGIDLDQLANDAWDTLPRDEMHKAQNWLEVCKKDKKTAPKMSDRAFITCDTLKRMWRNAHPNISQLWYDIEGAVKSAICNPAQTFRANKLAVRRDGTWLRIRLPSGRYLCYPNIRLKDDSIQYMGTDQYTRKWQYQNTYGGKIFENICQAMSRDILAHNMHAIDKAGYQIVLTVHDEVICEAPDNADFNHEHLSKLLATNPDWASDMPLAAGGFEAYRYRKD